MNILTGISRWLPLALCVSMAAVLLAGCGSETPATSAPTALPASTPMAPPTSRDDGSPHLHAHRPWHICGNTTTHSGAYNRFTT